MKKKELSWILYDWANSAYTLAITTTIFPIFFKDVAAKGMENYMSTSIIGGMNTVYTIIIALLAPILGTIADYQDVKKRFFTMFFILGIIGTFSLILVSEGLWVMAAVLYVIASIGFAGANVFYDSLLIDVTRRDRMDWISSSGFAWGYFGSTIPFIISIGIIMKPAIVGITSSLTAVRIAFAITGIWWLVFTIPFFLFVRQKYWIEPSRAPIRDSFKRISATFKNIKQYKHPFMFLIAYFFYIDGVHTIIKMATSYGKDIGMTNNTLMIVLLAVQLVAFPFALLYGKLAKKFTTKKMLIVGVIIYIFITIMAFCIPFFPTAAIKTGIFWGVSMLVATSQGGIQALSRSYYGKLIPKNKSGEFYGFYNILGKFAAVMGPFLVGFFSFIFRNSSYGVLSIVILFIVGLVILIRVKEAPEQEAESEAGAEA